MMIIDMIEPLAVFLCWSAYCLFALLESQRRFRDIWRKRKILPVGMRVKRIVSAALLGMSVLIPISAYVFMGWQYCRFIGLLR